MSSATPVRTTTSLTDTDQQMLDWLRDQFASKFKSEDGYGRRYADAVVARFAELIELQNSSRRILNAVEDAQKLAMAQMQFAQSALRQLERLEAIQDRPERRNGKREAIPAVDLKGE